MNHFSGYLSFFACIFFIYPGGKAQANEPFQRKEFRIKNE